MFLLLKPLLFEASSFSSYTVSGISFSFFFTDLFPVLTIALFSGFTSFVSVFDLLSLWGTFVFFDSVVTVLGAMTGGSSLSYLLLYSLTLERILLWPSLRDFPDIVWSLRVNELISSFSIYFCLWLILAEFFWFKASFFEGLSIDFSCSEIFSSGWDSSSWISSVSIFDLGTLLTVTSEKAGFWDSLAWLYSGVWFPFWGERYLEFFWRKISSGPLWLRVGLEGDCPFD